MFKDLLNPKRLIFTLILGAVIAGGINITSIASDHDDGEVNQHSLALTDLYVFRDSESPAAGSSDDIIFIMNSHPRSLPTVQNFFSSTARYEFHVTRVTDANKAVKPTGTKDITFRFEFGAPATDNTQTMTVTAVIDGTASAATTDTGGAALKTTTHAAGAAANNTVQTVSLAGQNVTVFAGLREDPFFFDVKAYFAVRAGIAAAPDTPTLSPNFNGVGSAEDFAKGYNVNAIVMKVPKALLNGGSATVNTFDVWETISVPN